MNPLVSIITVNYNQAEVTLDLLSSVEKLSYQHIEMIVVDNASPDDNPDVIKEKYPWVSLIKSEKNLGFAGGNNLGVKEAKGDYLLFINNDTIVPPDFIEPLLQTFRENPKAGMVSPKIKFHWDPNLIQFAGYTPMNPWTIRNHSIGYHEEDNGQHNLAKKTAGVHGAAMMIPRTVLERVGMMTEVYFLYYEEHDWAARVKKAGYELWYQPKSYILHKESLSTGKFSPLKTYYITRNRLLYARRNFNRLELAISMAFQLFVSIPKNSIKFLFDRQFLHFKAYWRAIGWNLSNFNLG